jgi:hypothetical protein
MYDHIRSVGINVLVGLGLSTFCCAQSVTQKTFTEEFPHRNIIKTNALTLFGGVVNIGFETRHSADASSQLEFFYVPGFFYGVVFEYKGVGLTYDYRYFISRNYPKGMYIEPFARLQKYNYVGSQNPTVSSAGKVYDHIAVIGSGMVLGYQAIFARRISFEVFAGPVYNVAYGDGTRISTTEIGPQMSGGWFRLGTTFGYAF